MRRVYILLLLLPIGIFSKCLSDINRSNQQMIVGANSQSGQKDTIFMLVDPQVEYSGFRLYPPIGKNYKDLLDEVVRTGIVLVLKNGDDIWIILNDMSLFGSYIDSLAKNIYNSVDYLKTKGYGIEYWDEPNGGIFITSRCDTVLLSAWNGDISIEFFTACEQGILQSEYLDIVGGVTDWLISMGFNPPMNLDTIGKRVRVASINSVGGSWFGELKQRPAVLDPIGFPMDIELYDFMIKKGKIRNVRIYPIWGGSLYWPSEF